MDKLFLLNLSMALSFFTPLRNALGSSMQATTQPAFNFSTLTIETLEQGVKYVQS